ncbi:(Fe-S)-binding protein [Clostridium formicaceticum]|uniref:(Fe-S)-binding protein n=1 Tax=Clostridium formicaceticum TaxID=1497 RepID=A0AAC9WHS6_9CLOT|nr:(Fe-S)-binding protein [Clostridium formicaceticum]AOY74879.1 (Fe-S)-binding protein [Clostridium formicaceticum]ARE89281.1 hypothetical protein CLFO_36880 [Clostridium formicaceticum]
MKDQIEVYIKNFVKEYPDKKGTTIKWQEPLIAYGAAKNPMFHKLKEVITPSHALPTDFLQDAETVIAYFLPFEEVVVKSNSNERESSELWGRAYVETNQLIFDLNSYLYDMIGTLGYKSTILPATHNFDQQLLISEWSHRHVAYIAGLGKFGINHMLITEKGCCGRIGSVVTNLKIEVTEIQEEEFCLYKAKGICGKCVKNCVNDALKIDGFDRHRCYEMCLYNDKLLTDIRLADVCGKCMVGIPCSYTNPMKK